MSKLVFFRSASVAGIVWAMMAGLPAVAQSGGVIQEAGNAQDENAQDEDAGLRTIVVTAQRREQSAQDVPIAINAFDTKAMETLRIQDMESLGVKVPALSISSFSKSRFNPSLRGGSSSLASAGAEQAVGLFIDDQYFGGVGDFEIDLFDVERIEVLRGPQGTLFGRNTTGGSINVVTRRPSRFFEGQFSATLGNYDALELRGYITGPLSDRLSALIAVSSRDRDGTSLNLTTGNFIEDVNRTSLRAKLLWEASATVDVVASMGFNRAAETGTARDAIFIDVPITDQDLIDAGFVPDEDPRVVQNFADGRYESDQWTANLRVTKDLGNAELLSVSTYRHFKSIDQDNSLDGVPLPIFAMGEPRAAEAFSQELRYTSDYAGRFNWIGGVYLYYSDERRDMSVTGRWNEYTYAGAVQAITFCPTQSFADFENGIVTPSCIADFPALFDTHEYFANERNRTTSISGYVDGSFEITDTLTAIGGVRWTYDRKKFDAVTGGDPSFLWSPPVSEAIDPATGVAEVGQVVDARDSWDEITYRAGLQYHPTRELNFYAMRSTGFRSGAFDAAQSDARLPHFAVAPERVTNNEIGAKTRLFNDKVQFNVALFETTYRNLQFFVFTGETGITTNAGQARVRGIETELTVAITDDLILSGQYVHQDGKTSDIPPEAEVVEGTPPQGTIPNTYVAAIDYNRDLSNGGRIFLHADFTRKERYNLELEDAPQFFSETNALVNASIGYEFPSGWEFSIWGQNLTNENIVIYGQNFWFGFYDGPTAFANPATIGATSQPRYSDPRTYGVTVRKEF